jgi:hypothetical protein
VDFDGSTAHENGLGDLLQFIFKIGQIMTIPNSASFWIESVIGNFDFFIGPSIFCTGASR